MNFDRLVRVLVARVFLSFAFLHTVMFSDFVRYYSAASPYCTSNECALTAAHKATYDSSACRRTANDLRRIVMTFIMSILLPLRLAMLLMGLRQRDYGLRENGCENCVDRN